MSYISMGGGGGGGSTLITGVGLGVFMENGANYPFYGSPIFPNAFYVTATNTTWVSWEGWDLSDNTRKFYVKTFNHTTGLWTPQVVVAIDPLQGDDHGNPSLVLLPGGYVLMLAGCHISACQQWVTTNAGDPTTWTHLSNVSADIVTYPHPFLVGSTLYLFLRGEGLGTESVLQVYKTTAITNGVPTWTARQQIAELGATARCYVGECDVSGTDIYVVCALKNAEIEKKVYVVIYDTTTGSVRNISGSHTVASGSQPVNAADMDTYFKVVDVYAEDFVIPGGCFDGSGNFHLVWPNTFYGAKQSPVYDVYHSMWNGSAWTNPYKLGSCLDWITAGVTVLPLNAGGARTICTYHNVVTQTNVYTPAGAVTPTTFDPDHLSALATLTNNNLTYTRNEVLGATVQNFNMTSVAAVTSGKYFCEITVGAISAIELLGLGIGNLRAVTTALYSGVNFLGGTTDGIGFWNNNGNVYFNNGVLTTIATYVAGDVVGIAFDVDAKLIWFRVNGGNWNNSGAANPATGAGGISTSSITTPYYVWVNDQDGLVASRMTANFGATAYAHAAPSGFGNLGSAAGWTAPVLLQEAGTVYPANQVNSPTRIWNATSNWEAIWSEVALFSDIGGFGYLRGWAWGENGFLQTTVAGNVVAPFPRTKLTAATTFWVNSAGSDTNTGLADNAAHAFKTFQGAYNAVTNLYDFGGQDVTIRAGNETGVTFAGMNLESAWVGGGTLTIEGNGSVNTTMTDGPGPFGDTISIFCVLPGTLFIGAIKLTSVGESCIYHAGIGLIQINDDVNFGAATDSHMFVAAAGAHIDVCANYKISGGAGNHLAAILDGIITDAVTRDTAYTVTITGTPFFLNFARARGDGVVQIRNATYSGGATGRRFFIDGAGTILVPAPADPLYFPGATSGQVLGGNYTDLSSANGYEVIGGQSAGGASLSYVAGVNTELNFICEPGTGIGWTTTTFLAGLGIETFDTGWFNDATGIVAQRHGANAQAARIHGTYTSSTNFEALRLDAGKTTANTNRIIADKGSGGGTARIIALDAFSKAGAPANTDLPSGTWALIDDTTNNQTWLCFNKAGTIRKVQLT